MIRVIGLGNAFRRDDSAGLEVARLLRDRAVPGVEVVESDGDPARLMLAWEDAEVAVVVDAIRADDPPGTVHRFDVTGPAPVDLPAGTSQGSTHGLGLGEAVALAQALDRLPPHLTVIGIVGGDFGMGEGLSDPVSAAVAQLVDDLDASLASPATR
jgi:hydrogenase maturation protease